MGVSVVIFGRMGVQVLLKVVGDVLHRGGDRVLPAGPLAQIDGAAALAAEGEVGGGGGDRLPADGAVQLGALGHTANRGMISQIEKLPAGSGVYTGLGLRSRYEPSFPTGRAVLCALRPARTHPFGAHGGGERAAAVDRGGQCGRAGSVRRAADEAGRDPRLGRGGAAGDAGAISDQSVDS